MPRGRPNKPKLLPIGTESQPLPGDPDCPSYLGAMAKKKWAEVLSTITPGLLAKIDLDVLAMYCTAFERWRKAENVMKKQKLVLKGKHGYGQNPNLAIANRAMEQMRQFSVLLGLDPSSRQRLKVVPPKKKEENPKSRFFKAREEA